jgi:hypothetical protein
MIIKLIFCSILGSSIAYFGLIVFPSTSKKKKGGSHTIDNRLANWSKILKMDMRLIFF